MPIPLTAFDIGIFLASILAVLAIGLWAGRKEDTSEDFYLAGKTVPWWGVAGSIFGTNVSADHLVGMLGIGYSIGFAQAHFEYGAIAGLLMLAFLFLPLYRRMGLYTLSEYLARRYDDRSSVLYSAFNILMMVFVRMALGFYIGARALSFLLDGTPLEIGYLTGILIFAVVTATYTIVGGLKAVIWTDVMQSVLLLLAGVFVAALVFSQPEIGGLGGLLAKDAALPESEQKFHLYLPTDHPQLPWTGVFSGLLIIHIFYWSTNQFIVQRALAARSEFDAKMGILVAGFLKLLIPFVSIATGVAAGFLFESRLAGGELTGLPLPDDAFPLLVQLVVPAGYGLVGVITAGLIGAILSSIDSMMNSGATLFTFDFYKRFINPGASERRLILVGRAMILLFVAIAACIAGVIYTEDAADNFFPEGARPDRSLRSWHGGRIPGGRAVDPGFRVRGVLVDARLPGVLVRDRMGLRRLGGRRLASGPVARAATEFPPPNGLDGSVCGGASGCDQHLGPFRPCRRQPVYLVGSARFGRSARGGILAQRKTVGWLLGACTVFMLVYFA